MKASEDQGHYEGDVLVFPEAAKPTERIKPAGEGLKDPIEVQQAWIEGLIKHSERVDRSKAVLDSSDPKQLMFLCDLSQLQGYIESAKYLLPRTSKDTTTTNPKDKKEDV